MIDKENFEYLRKERAKSVKSSVKERMQSIDKFYDDKEYVGTPAMIKAAKKVDINDKKIKKRQVFDKHMKSHNKGPYAQVQQAEKAMKRDHAKKTFDRAKDTAKTPDERVKQQLEQQKETERRKALDRRSTPQMQEFNEQGRNETKKRAEAVVLKKTNEIRTAQQQTNKVAAQRKLAVGFKDLDQKQGAEKKTRTVEQQRKMESLRKQFRENSHSIEREQKR